MKKFLTAFALVTSLVFSSTTVMAKSEITVYVNGSKVIYDVQPIIQNGSTLVPLRQTFEALGSDVAWDSATQTVTIGDSSVTNKPTTSTTSALGYSVDGDYLVYNNSKYKIIEVDGGDLSGSREPNVAVDIGYGDRVYWGLTNKNGQLIYVLADKITLQNSATEKLKSNGRYYNDEAKVPGTELSNYDEGHVIADSLGGVSNAYNITPQNSTLNRAGEQAEMEGAIRNSNGCSNFLAVITYPNATTQTPSKYSYEFVLSGNKVTKQFENKSPNDITSNTSVNSNPSTINSGLTDDISKIDTNGNGKVTIAEAKAAGFKMPISSSHWLYKYMDDGDNDGFVGE